MANKLAFLQTGPLPPKPLLRDGGPTILPPPPAIAGATLFHDPSATTYRLRVTVAAVAVPVAAVVAVVEGGDPLTLTPLVLPRLLRGRVW